MGVTGAWKALLGARRQRARYVLDDVVGRVLVLDGDVTLVNIACRVDAYRAGAMRPPWSTEKAVFTSMDAFMEKWAGPPLP